MAAMTAGLLLLAGCSAGDDAAAPAQEPTTDTAETTEQVQTPETAAPATSPSEQSTGAATSLDDALASSSGADGDTDLLLALNSVERRGQTLNVTFSVTNNSDDNWQVGQFFSGPRREDVDSVFTLAGVSVIDSDNGRRYPTVFDSSGACVCDSDLTNRFIDAGQSGRFSAVTGAPPADVANVDVQIPGFGTFSGIPLSGS